MKAMVLAAGLGTRLRPLTNNRPKALVEISGRTLLAIALQRLRNAGFTDIIINVHHFADKIIDFIRIETPPGMTIHISDERETLLDTGGGLKKAAWFFNDKQPFLLCNVDALTDLNLSVLYDSHCASNALATLAVQSRISNRYLLFDEDRRLSGWRNVKTGETRLCSKSCKSETLKECAFSGIQVLSPEIFDFMFPEDRFSIIDMYLKAADTQVIRAYPHDEGLWFDVGTPQSLQKVEQLIVAGKLRI